MRSLILISIMGLIGGCSFFLHKEHVVEPLSSKNQDLFRENCYSKFRYCFDDSKLRDDEALTTHLVVLIDESGLMRIDSFYPEVRSIDYKCVSNVVSNMKLKDSSDFKSKRRAILYHYKISGLSCDF